MSSLTKDASSKEVGIKAIVLLTKFSLNAFAGIYGWVPWVPDIVGGIAEELVSCGFDKMREKKELRAQFDEASDRALERLDYACETETEKRIFNEMNQDVTYVKNTSDLFEIIKKTEAFRELYATEKDIKRIADKYEQLLREEVAKQPVLSAFILIQGNLDVLEILRSTANAIYANGQTLNKIDVTVTETNILIHKVVNLATEIFSFLFWGMGAYVIVGGVFELFNRPLSNQLNYFMFALLAQIAAFLISKFLKDKIPTILQRLGQRKLNKLLIQNEELKQSTRTQMLAARDNLKQSDKSKSPERLKQIQQQEKRIQNEQRELDEHIEKRRVHQSRTIKVIGRCCMILPPVMSALIVIINLYVFPISVPVNEAAVIVLSCCIAASFYLKVFPAISLKKYYFASTEF